MATWSQEKLARYEEKHRARCLKYYWKDPDAGRERQRRTYRSRTVKASVHTNRKKTQRKPDVEHTPLGPCSICNDKYTDHGLCSIIWEVRERLK